MKFILVSAADAAYFPLLRDLVLSIRVQSRGAAAEIGVLDLGLAADQIAWLTERGAAIVAPGWDVDFPGRERTPTSFKAQISRPFLPKHFPGYDAYMWIDADAWVQDWSVIDLYLSAAARGDIAIAAEIDRAYKRHYKRPKILGWTLTHRCYRQAFGWRVADRLGRNPMLNIGVFAMRADSAHWQPWAETLAQVLQRTRFFFVEQIAINYCIFERGLPANILPAWCNWMVGDAAPVYDPARKALVEPFAPYTPLGVVHLAGPDQKNREFALRRLDGGELRTNLRYSAASAHLAAG